MGQNQRNKYNAQNHEDKQKNKNNNTNIKHQEEGIHKNEVNSHFSHGRVGLLSKMINQETAV